MSAVTSLSASIPVHVAGNYLCFLLMFPTVSLTRLQDHDNANLMYQEALKLDKLVIKRDVNSGALFNRL